MRGAIQSLPSSCRSPSRPWIVLPFDMNLKNFPKKLDSKTSCLRITVPENLDLALEGLIRKVLREQPKVDDIYAFAADYFDTLLKIRDKAGTKFTVDQLCPFHNDEDAHEMIKLASTFPKPGSVKPKTPESEKIKNAHAKTRRKEFSKSIGKSDKTIENVKQPAVIQKKPKRLPEKKKDELNFIKPEIPKTLKLEPKTEDVGEDEEFLKSDPIKVLVEKDLMDAAKLRPKDKEEVGKDETCAKQNDKSEEAVNEELCAVVDKDNIRTEEGRADEIVSKTKDEITELQVVDKPEEVVKEVREENETMEKKEMEIQNETKDKAAVESVTEALDSNKDRVTEEIKTEFQNDAKEKEKEGKAEIKSDNLESRTEDEDIKTVEIPAVENETEEPLESESKTEGKTEEITDSDIKNEETKEAITEVQNIAEGKPSDEKTELRGDTENKTVNKTEIITEAQDSSVDKEIKEPSPVEEENINPDELCRVVDILSIIPPKQEGAITEVKEAKAEEPESITEEGVDKVKIELETVPTQEEKEISEVQKSAEATEKPVEKTSIDINSDEKKIEQEQENHVPENVKAADELPNTEISTGRLEIQTEPEDNKSDEKTSTTTEKEEIDSEATKLVSSEDQKPAEGNTKDTQDNDAVETEIIKDVREDHTTTEEKEVEEKGKPETAVENEVKDTETVEEQVQSEEPTEAVETKEHLHEPEKIEAENVKDIKPAETSEVEEETQTPVKNEIKAEELSQNNAKTEEVMEDNLKREISSITDEQKPSDEPPNIKEEQTSPAEVPKQEELKPEEEIESAKDVEDKIEVVEKEKNSEEQKENSAAELEEYGVKETQISEEADHTTETILKDSETETPPNMQDLDDKPNNETQESETAETVVIESTGVLETSKTEPEPSQPVEGDELCTVVDAEHVIKIEDIEGLPEEVPFSEGVQIKTIQTHYYDTLQVPEQVTKEYRVHTVKNDNLVDSLIDTANVILSSDKEQVTEAVTTNLELPTQELDKMDLEDSLMTPSSNYSLNLSELSVQTINEMFLESEKQYSAMDREERRYVTKTGEKCGDESQVEKQEVEEIIHKTIVPAMIGATPVAPRDDSEINEEANIEEGLKKEKKEEPSMDSNEPADSSNEGRSLDSDTPIISVEVKTVIETLEEDEKENNGGGGESDVQIRIEVDVPEGMTIDLKEQKENADEVEQDASDKQQTSESVPKNSQTSSGESESTISSTCTEIKRSDFTKRHFSSTRTLITTQSLDLDKRNLLLKTKSLSSFRQGVTDFEVWNAIEKELEEAATKIQSNFRGYKTRKKLQRENAVQVTTEESSCSITPVEPETEPRDERQQSTGEFHDSIVLSEHPR